MTTSRSLKVVLVDDSLTIRSLVRRWIEAEPDMSVVGTASSGEKGIVLVAGTNPDLVVLDVEMPGLNGPEALERMRAEGIDVPVVFFTSTTPEQAELGMQLLSTPNTAWVNKPASNDSLSSAEDCRETLIETIREITGLDRAPAPAPEPALPREAPKSAKPFGILAIGSSTGGPDALDAVLSRLPADLGMPVVIVQHMPAHFTQHLANRLDASSPLTISQGTPGEEILAGHGYVAPGDYHMVLERDGLAVRLNTNRDPREHSCRPAVDPLFRSVVDVYGSSVLGVVLTGMGQDGAAGAAAIRSAGGRVLVQDEATSVVWGMPGEVYRTGQADEVHPLQNLSLAIVSAIAKRQRLASESA